MTIMSTSIQLDVVLEFMVTSLSGTEGGSVEVCVVITNFPTGGVEISVSLELGTTDGIKACTSYTCIQLLPHDTSMQKYELDSI